MIKNTIIIALVIVLIYLYYQQKQKPNLLTRDSSELAEIKTKLGKKSLDEILEENEDYETEVDTLTRSKNSLEQDLTSPIPLKRKRSRNQKTWEKLTSEKQQHKGSLERITKLTEQITNLQKEQPELEQKLNLKEQNIKDYKEQIKELGDKSTIINTYLTTKIKELETEISTLNLQDSAQFNRSKSLKQILKVLEGLKEE